MSDRSKPSLEMNAEGDVWLRTPTDGGWGDDVVTLLGHVTHDPDVPEGLEDELAALLDQWNDGLDFAQGCRAAADAGWRDHVGSPR